MGRLAKFEIGRRVIVNERAPADYDGRVGTVTEKTPDRSEYGVRFDDGLLPTTGFFDSHWLDCSVER